MVFVKLIMCLWLIGSIAFFWMLVGMQDACEEEHSAIRCKVVFIPDTSK